MNQPTNSEYGVDMSEDFGMLSSEKETAAQLSSACNSLDAFTEILSRVEKNTSKWVFSNSHGEQMPEE